jgi:NADH:ubiquinone oxidoreductase subunit E
MPSLYAAERYFGWLSPEAMSATGHLLDLPEAYVRGVASFYSMYRHEPLGKYIILLCTNLTCMLMDSDAVLRTIKDRFGISPGETSEDGRFTLMAAECLGQCDGAPAMLVGEDVRTSLSPDNIISILESYT